jgi:hypothetical protein
VLGGFFMNDARKERGGEAKPDNRVKPSPALEGLVVLRLYLNGKKWPSD